ncbi:hypothetical protein GH714_015366 [Hevea brasiliensis]|uniref:Protein kinase domain-containing protein n=1 Tax=Hevea brasiliensis TaxID=3981 RepID=A0A6A6KC34_HEVBR|nr:hypothetical protein GH714_015366 [Hevea brasiliensis]
MPADSMVILAFEIQYAFGSRSYGQWLGLTNASTDSNPENHIVAIEFDTLKQDDIDVLDGDHIGLNINTIKSEKAVSLDEYNLTLSPPPPGANYSVWVDYNGTTKVMQIYMAKEGNSKPQEPILSHIIDLKKYLKKESYFGFAASTGDPQIELNCVLKWDFQIENIPEERDEKSWWKIVVGAGVPAGTITMITAIYGCVHCMRKRRSSSSSGSRTGSAEAEEQAEFGKLKWLPGMPREFKYKELKKAANNFHESMKLGEGGFGIVYKGVLHEKSREEIAVKKFSRDNIKGKDDFLAELTIIHRLRHKNLVRLVGLGGVPGTMGYVAPECFHTGRATPESDVFGFGAVVLEVVCGKGPGTKIHHNQHLYSLVDWVWMLHREGRIQEAVDERLKNDFVESEVNRLLLLGLACSHPIESARPKTQAILQIVSGALPPPHVPPFKPVFTWPSMSNTGNTDTSLSGSTLSSQVVAEQKV